MTNRKDIYDSIKMKMEKAGFQFETEQKPHLQNRKENELKFVHPKLIKRLEKGGVKVNAKKFYVKPLSNEIDCEIGFVTGKSSPLYKSNKFTKPNSTDTFDNIPAWTNSENNNAIDRLLESIEDYLKTLSDVVEFIKENKYIKNSIVSNDVTNQFNKTYKEGKSKDVVQTRYERNPEARKKCLEYFGYSCKVCSYAFEKHFGEIGKGFIHVHHINQISEIGKEYEVDPIKDLIPVCPNCHAMIHSKQPAFTIEEIKEIIK